MAHKGGPHGKKKRKVLGGGKGSRKLSAAAKRRLRNRQDAKKVASERRAKVQEAIRAADIRITKKRRQAAKRSIDSLMNVATGRVKRKKRK